MKKYPLAVLALCYIACGGPDAQSGQPEAGAPALTHETHDHDHEAHDHDHEAHDHDHEAHDHDHEAHDHDHEAHDHDHEAHDHDHEAHDYEAHADRPGHSDEIVFTARQAAMGEFALEQAARAPFAPVIKVSGRIVSSPADYREVVAPAAGQVQLEARIAPGTQVAAGEPIARIVSKNLADGDTYARVASQYEYARTQWERAERLIEDRIITRSDYQQAKRDYQTARQAYLALEGSDEKGVVVRAPLAGYLRSVEAVPGAYVEKGGALFSIVRASRGRLETDVPQKYYARLPEVASAVFTAQDGTSYDTDSLNGKVVSYTRSVSPSGLLSLTMEYDVVSDVPQGAFVQVSLRLRDKKDAITVPLSALTEEQGMYFVYVQLDEEGYQKRPVTVGQDDGVRAEILSGLDPGETFVSRGAYRVKLASASGAIPHSHEH